MPGAFVLRAPEVFFPTFVSRRKRVPYEQGTGATEAGPPRAGRRKGHGAGVPGRLPARRRPAARRPPTRGLYLRLLVTMAAGSAAVSPPETHGPRPLPRPHPQAPRR